MADTKSKIGGDSKTVKNTMSQVDNSLFDYLKTKQNGGVQNVVPQYPWQKNPVITNQGEGMFLGTPKVGPKSFTPSPEWLNSIGWNDKAPKVQAPAQKPVASSNGLRQVSTPSASGTALIPNTSQQMNPRTLLVEKWKQSIDAKQKAAPQGNANSQVAELQKKLTAAGFNPGRVDGIMGPKTQAALQAFNAAQQAQVNASTNVPTEDFYRRQAEADREAYLGINTNPMQTMAWSKPDFKTLTIKKDGGKIISDIISEFKKGGKIKIKPENKGKFTATKKSTGKSTEELTNSKNPITKKRAVFAQNAAKWKKG